MSRHIKILNERDKASAATLKTDQTANSGDKHPEIVLNPKIDEILARTMRREQKEPRWRDSR